MTAEGLYGGVCNVARPLLYSAGVFYRVLVVGIVIFWGWMTTLLLRLEWTPSEGQMLTVPTAHVWKLIFRHEEASELALFNGRRRLGTLHLQPKQGTTAGGPFHQLTGTGAFALDLPGLTGERLVLHGTLDLDEHEQIQHVEIAANFHEPKQKLPGITIILDGEPPRDQWHYAIRQGEDVRKEKSGTMDALLDDPDLRAVGFDPKVFGQASRQQAAATTVTARHGTLHLNGEDVETYVVTIRQGDGLESSVHLNQLGQILAVKTFLGYDLYDEAFAP